jgi:hypothetical protein
LLSRPDEVLSFLQQGGEAICAHCSIDILSVGNPSEPDSASLTPCWHVVCAGCIQQHKSAPGNAGNYVCSLCQSQHPIHEVSPQDHAEHLGGATHVPSKIRCLVDDLSTYIEHCKR